MQSPKKIGEDIAKATADWKGLKVTVTWGGAFKQIKRSFHSVGDPLILAAA